MIVYCKSCEGQASDAAATCPHCGHPLKEPAIPLVTLTGKPRWIIAGVVASAAIALISYFAMRDGEAQSIAAPAVAAREPPVAKQAPPREPQTVTGTGLGWSVKHLQALWGDDNGWSWFTTVETEGGEVEVSAMNFSYAVLRITADGPPDDLTRITAMYLYDPKDSPESRGYATHAEGILMPMKLAAKITGADVPGALAWLDEVLSRMPATGDRTVADLRTSGPYVIVVKVDQTAGELRHSVFTAVERSDAEGWQPPKPQPETPTGSGLGWSVSRIETSWGFGDVWSWETKSANGNEIEYRATNRDWPGLYLTVYGPPDDLTKISCTYAYDPKGSDLTAAGTLVPMRIAATVAGANPPQLLVWLDDLATRMPATGERAVFGRRPCGPYMISARIDFTQEPYRGVTAIVTRTDH